MDDCPNGYPRLAAFLSSEASFGVYRAFHYLHARVLLELQDQAVVLERELGQKDSLDQHNGLGDRLQSRARDQRISRRDNEDRPRREILEDLRRTLVQYGP